MRANALTVLFLACMMLIACGEVELLPSSDEIRIVSLSPSITATIADIGYGDAMVGRSPFCKSVDQGLPVVGDLYEIDYERLLRLKPSHVFVQKTIDGVDDHLTQLAADGYFSLHSWRIDRFDDIQRVHADILEIFNEEAFSLQVSFDHCELPASILIMTSGSKGAVGLCFGRETYLDDLLVMMGGTNALQRKGWISLSLEDLGKLHPAVIVIVSDSFISDSSISLVSSLGVPIISFVHEDVLIPSSRIIDVATKLHEAVKLQ